MKKIIALSLALVLVLALAACGGSASSTAAPASTAPAAAASTADTSTTDATPPADGAVRVALVCEGAVNDGGWNAKAYEGLQRIENELGLEVAYSEKVPVAEMAQVIRTYARQGYNLIFGHGSQFGEPMASVAPEFPDVTFVPVNASESGPNMSGTVFKFGECGYFCGMAAAMVSESGIIGIIPPDDAPNNQADVDTYKLGAQSVNPDIEVLIAYTGSWDDLPKAKEAAESLINQGADVLQSLGDAYAVGVYQACEEAKIHSLGWVTDQYDMSPETVIASGLQDIASMYVGTAQRYVDGTMEMNTVQVYGMPDGAQGMSEFYGLTDEQAATVEQAMQDYLDGKLEIPTLY